MSLIDMALRKENAALSRKIHVLEDSVFKLDKLNVEFSMIAVTAIETLEFNKIILTPAQAKFIKSYREYQKMMGTDAEVTIAPPINDELAEHRKKKLQEMVG